ncbi:3 beta-hydroxysteroid dehydrogenase/Delta 5--_4-isomerase [Ktedonobacter sp. SOSP1-85]|uniref:NAD-dependent epimerase/dehydratase family protein n=1 Tax=Ktedonobacter sp. SOSP1-85 TaxID=2778367 RepID=UPI0019165B73|nr:NAD-dependent epimerase/dehydratase family protein [Ktedonobacter sp. SOSP1-85]GHO75315.1 3 beta-hydroxysteroid dehydrogenase/Delta 5-->4-isomerase [Ktedonobacter sp. SOSP1-85]
MRVLVTGATGLLGGHLVKALRERDEWVRALVLPAEDARSLEELGVEVVRGDITEAGALVEAVRGSELVFHLAGMMGVWRPLAEYRRVNVEGTRNLYKVAMEAGVRRFVHTSSHTVYGLGYGRFLTEDEPLRPDNDSYSLSKAEGDRLVRRLMLTSPMETVIIRPGTFFGPGDRLHFARMAEKLRRGRGVILGRGDNHLPFCYVDDIVQGYLLAGYHPQAPGNVYNITNDQPLTQLEMFSEIADAVGGERPRLHLPYQPIRLGAICAEKLVARMTRTRPLVTELGALMFGSDNKHSIEKARRELGYAPQVGLRKGIQLAAQWFNG